MKKIFFITFIAFLLFAGCMVNPQDNLAELEDQTPTTEAAPKQEVKPAQEETPAETPKPKIKATRERSIPAEETIDSEAPNAPDEPEEADITPETAEPRIINWVAFYNRVLQKGREKYKCKLPWSNIAKDAGLKLGSWMVDAGNCNRKPPKEDEIRKIADVLDVSYEWLIYGEE